MNNQDRNEADRLTAKNSVEEYIYDIRGKLCEELEEFMIEDDRNKYSLELEDAENWLYEDGEFAEKPEYQKKLSELQTKGEAAKRRRHEFEARPEAINQFGQCLQLAQKAVDNFKVSSGINPSKRHHPNFIICRLVTRNTTILMQRKLIKSRNPSTRNKNGLAKCVRTSRSLRRRVTLRCWHHSSCRRRTCSGRWPAKC